jgi:hypothetical protein
MPSRPRHNAFQRKLRTSETHSQTLSSLASLIAFDCPICSVLREYESQTFLAATEKRLGNKELHISNALQL